MKYLAIFLSIFTLSPKTFAATFCQQRSHLFEEGGFKVEVLKYQSARLSAKTILIIPPTGGTNVLDRKYADTLCEQGFDVLILHHWTNDNEFSMDLEIHKRFYQRSQRAIGIVLNNIKTPFVGILGTSVGAIHAAVAVHRYDKINAAFLITGGAPISEVTANSDQEVLQNVRQKRFAMMGFKSQKEYVEALDEVLPMDPFNSPHLDPGKKLAMVIAPQDTTVPGANQQALRRLWKPQWVLELSGNHFLAILKTWLFHRDEMVQFFKQSAE